MPARALGHTTIHPTMKPDILSLGDFPPGMMAALAARFTVHHFIPYPLPDGALAPDVAGRIRAVATEANRGASRDLIARLPRLEIIASISRRRASAASR